MLKAMFWILPVVLVLGLSVFGSSFGDVLDERFESFKTEFRGYIDGKFNYFETILDQKIEETKRSCACTEMDTRDSTKRSEYVDFLEYPDYQDDVINENVFHLERGILAEKMLNSETRRQVEDMRSKLYSLWNDVNKLKIGVACLSSDLDPDDGNCSNILGRKGKLQHDRDVERTTTSTSTLPTAAVCGRSQYEEFESGSDRISSGSEAKNHSSPWHVTFRTTFYNTDGIKVTFCGGTLISKTWILTAAHCITNLQNIFGRDFNRNNVDLYLGTNNCEGLDGIKVLMKRTITHPDFQKNDVYLDNDVALIELLEPVQYTNRIKPMCLEPKQFIDETFFRRQVGEWFGRVVGCGRLKSRGIRPDWLREVYVPYVPRSTCQAATIKTFTDSMICAGFEVERKGDSCGGDDGGSLVMQRDGENRWIQVGIVSWGVGCDRLGTYGYYTDVGYFYPWIKHHTNFDEEGLD